MQNTNKTFKELENWFKQVNQKAAEAVYIPLSDRFNQADSYKKSFKRCADFFDPQSE